MERESFGSRIGFIFASAASAIGLGNFWRFPYLVNEYGGGTFILIYLVSVLTFGLILVTLEVAIGRMTGKSALEAFGVLIKKYKWLGWIAVIVPIVLLGYYCVIGGWVLRYAMQFIGGDIAPFIDLESSTNFFNNFVTETGDLWNGPVLWFVIFLLLSTLLIIGGVHKGIELLSKIFLPILLILMAVLVVIVFTLPGIGVGIEGTFIPTLEGLTLDSVTAAIGQVFFSVSVGSGILIAYGSYLSKKESINSTVRITVVMESIVAVGCAALIVPVAIAFAGGVSVSGPGLMFEVIPTLFLQSEYGRLTGILFFSLVFIAAITSSISLTEAVVAPLEDSCKIKRKKGVFVALIVSGIIGLLCCLSLGELSGITILGMNILKFTDFFSSNILMPISALITCIVVGYVFGTERVIDEIGAERTSKFAVYFHIMIKYICPVILVFIFVASLVPT